MQFPNVDPIPIPAPVWLMKGLELLTLCLHFFVVQAMIGSLIALLVLSLGGKSQAKKSATWSVARRLPIVMTYVINFGVPPLLFVQVLYGRALYTSSVLIGAMWISVIPLLMLCYWLMYLASDRAMKGKAVFWPALLALLVAAGVGQIYSTNMTLMIRPEGWQQMYASSPTGAGAVPHDPTLIPRWLWMISGGFVVGGLWMALNSAAKSIGEESAKVLRKTGLGLTMLGTVLELAVGMWVRATQPVNVVAGLQTPYYSVCFVLWIAGLVLVLLIGGIHLAKSSSSAALGWLGSVAAFLSIGGFVLYRDGIRDVTLAAKGFNVWDRVGNDYNWQVTVLFLLLFVVGLGVAAWLLNVMRQAKPVSEEVKA